MIVTVLNEVNYHLNQAKGLKRDEYFTRMEDIENELRYYKFKNKVVYCNCDDYNRSNFFRYFYKNFDKLKLKKLIATGIRGKLATVTRKHNKVLVTKLHKDKNYKAGDFRSTDCLKLLQEADVVVTNPPYSLFRKYFDILQQYHKDFLIISNLLAGTYSNVFPYFINNTVRFGVNKVRKFHVGGVRKPVSDVVTSHWLTNLPTPEKKPLPLLGTYSPSRYPMYVNYNAINVDSLNDIPSDYYGVMGLPITILANHNPNQFKLVGTTRSEYRKKLGRRYSNKFPEKNSSTALLKVNGKYVKVFVRVFVQRV